ncbi:GNAT family N-acetyltransferase [Calothrix rhizosoleniae]|uniref:GNAT family N-acetyltransferase n=1 Tax=Calothrix rhizosoleniae TaxID=888997 RepID=UPI000B4A4472|nr:GNAT family N-acetyltransferase [Calothrix rhizosoleniae]
MDVLETKRLLLRQQSLEDIELLHRIFADPITMSFWQFPFTSEATKNWVRRNIHSYSQLGFGHWSIILKETQELIGDCGILLQEIDGVLEYDLGYIIHHPYWQRGYATEAAGACKQYGLEILKLPRLIANMPINHVASVKVAEKIGMTWQKTFNNPKNRDIATHIYANST